MTNETNNIPNNTFTTIAQEALKNLGQAETKREKASELLILALFKAHYEVSDFGDSITISGWSKINGSIEKARKATWNDNVMRIVFSLDGKANKNNPNGYTAYQLKAVNAVMPVVCAAIEIGEDAIIQGKNGIKISGRLVFPDDVDMQESMFALNGKTGLSVANATKNAKAMLGLTKAKQETNQGERNHSKAAVTMIESESVISKTNKASILDTACDIMTDYDNANAVEDANALAVGNLLQQVATFFDTNEDSYELALNCGLDGRMLIEVLQGKVTLKEALAA